jgi:hypothetical protein
VKCSFDKVILFDEVLTNYQYSFLLIQLNQPTRCNIFTSLLLDVYVWLNMFRAPPRPPSGAYNCTSSLCFYCWKVAVAALLVVVWLAGQTTTNNAATVTLQR